MASDIGMPEWSSQHWRALDEGRVPDDQRSWTADPYRRCCTTLVHWGFAAFLEATGNKSLHNPAFFDYLDRYDKIEPSDPTQLFTVSWSTFPKAVWRAVVAQRP